MSAGVIVRGIGYEVVEFKNATYRALRKGDRA